MSLQSFQRAVVDLTLSPWAVRELREDSARWLAGYDLTGRERDRLWDIVTQRGISVNCSLSRGNRFEIIAQAFPMTCVLLRPVLRPLVDELWQERRPTNYQLSGEEIAFAAIVKRKIAAGELHRVSRRNIRLRVSVPRAGPADADGSKCQSDDHSRIPALARRPAAPVKSA
jgi:hypothetical protein